MAIGGVGGISVGAAGGPFNLGPLEQIGQISQLGQTGLAQGGKAIADDNPVNVVGPPSLPRNDRVMALADSLNRLAASSNLAGSGAQALDRINQLLVTVDFHLPALRQAYADELATLMIQVLDDLNQQKRQQSDYTPSPLVQLLLTQALVAPPVGVFVDVNV